MSILNYMVTLNHVHLLGIDKGKKDVIPKSMQLVAGRTGQEYNQRKNRKGAYWEDRYHAPAVESGGHASSVVGGLFGVGTYDELKSSHRGWIEEYLGDGKIRASR